MDKSTHELTEEIEDTRTNLANDINELHDKLSPAAIVDRKKEAAKDKVSSIKEKVMGTASDTHHSTVNGVSSAASTVGDKTSSAASTVAGTPSQVAHKATAKTQGNPLGAGIVAFGAGMLMSSLIPASQKEARATGVVMDKAKENSGPLVDSVKTMASDLGTNLQDSATQAVDQVKATAADSKSRVAEDAKSSAATVKDEVKKDDSSGADYASDDYTSVYSPATTTSLTSETYPPGPKI